MSGQKAGRATIYFEKPFEFFSRHYYQNSHANPICHHIHRDQQTSEQLQGDMYPAQLVVSDCQIFERVDSRLELAKPQPQIRFRQKLRHPWL